MGIDVVWLDGSGMLLKRLETIAYDVRLSRAIAPERSHCLQYIDPAGDVIFNQLQLPRLIQELEEATAAQLHASKLRENGLAVLEFVRGCEETHTYVKFIGD
jgi:hypothetical protein